MGDWRFRPSRCDRSTSRQPLHCTRVIRIIHQEENMTEAFPTRLQVLGSERIPNSNSFSKVIFNQTFFDSNCQDWIRFATLSRPCSLSLTKPTKLGLCSRLVVLQWIGICGGLRDAKPLKYSLTTHRQLTDNSQTTHQVSQVLS